MTLRPSAARCQRLGATIRVHVDQERNSSSAVEEPRCINCFILLSSQFTLIKKLQKN
jgi:hypothetical protein